MKLSKATLFYVVYCGQQADDTAGLLTPIRGGCSCLPVDDILPLPAEDMIDNIGEESDVDGETRHRNPSSFVMTKKASKSLNGLLD